MSRCFPYPPPGYTLSRASNDALIESIKLQKEREKSKSERKKEKKEKKKDRKEKKKAKEEKAKQIKAHSEHDLYRGEILKFVKGEFPQKERKDDTEQLERSSITEEHEQPICSQNPSYSSDSTQNSNKRKRQSSPINGTRVLGTGNILRIRLPSQKHIKHDIRDDEEKLCSTSGRIDVPAEHKNDVAVARAHPDKSYSTSSMAAELVHGLPLRSDQELTQPNDAKQQDTYLENVNTDSGSKSNKKLKRVVARYRELIENWTPASVPRETADNDNDEDWLFGRSREVVRSEKMPRVSTEMTCSSSASLWPRAHYLPDVDIYALPYTIPF